MKMKKIICLVLILALSLSLCACGGDSAKTKEELLEIAQDYTSWSQFNRSVDNKQKADSLVGETCLVFGYVDQAYSEYCTVYPTSNKYSSSVYLNIYLSKEELDGLRNGNAILAVGIIDSTKTEYSDFLRRDIVSFNIKGAYLIDPFEYADLEEMIDIFGGDGGDGCVDWTEGSYPYFMHYREEYKLLENNELIDTLVASTWKTKYYISEDSNIMIDFHDDNTLTFVKDGESEEWNWKLDEGYLYFSKRTWEVRQVNNDTLVFYEDNSLHPPMWLLVKDYSNSTEVI